VRQRGRRMTDLTSLTLAEARAALAAHLTQPVHG
jgi:hypothetical protein